MRPNPPFLIWKSSKRKPSSDRITAVSIVSVGSSSFTVFWIFVSSLQEQNRNKENNKVAFSLIEWALLQI
ncbi:MAG: hypothetical protein DCE86_09855 [Flavobacteriaceae bacterium]|nr:MAG: hypothetical protein DCE86_09855 [Flavobacteriaceae bacterium]